MHTSISNNSVRQMGHASSRNVKWHMKTWQHYCFSEFRNFREKVTHLKILIQEPFYLYWLLQVWCIQEGSRQRDVDLYDKSKILNFLWHSCFNDLIFLINTTDWLWICVFLILYHQHAKQRTVISLPKSQRNSTKYKIWQLRVTTKAVNFETTVCRIPHDLWHSLAGMRMWENAVPCQEMTVRQDDWKLILKTLSVNFIWHFTVLAENIQCVHCLKMTSFVFWVMMPSSHVSGYQHTWETYTLSEDEYYVPLKCWLSNIRLYDL
jgi:hypothetical protein